MALRGRGGGVGAGGRGGAVAGGDSPARDGAPKVPGVEWFADTITAHAWNKDRTKVAFCPNNSEVRIYSKDGEGDWVLDEVLDEHDKVVTGIDWAPETNRLVTCGQDRNAYVWTFNDQKGKWVPTLVILRINRAATHVKWSPNEMKFAVASGSKCVSICYFEKDNDWWVSKHIKKHKSTVTDISWHHGNILLATASTDYNARVFSTFIKELDAKPSSTPFGTKLPFGCVLAEYPSAGWVHGIDWAPSGYQLAFVGHDSTVNFLDVTNGAQAEFQIIRVQELPFTCLLFASEDAVVAAGHSCYPVLFTRKAGQWSYDRNLDKQDTSSSSSATPSRAAFQMFQNKVETGQSTRAAAAVTKHKNSITCIQRAGGSWDNVREVSTSSLDGRLVLFKL